MRDQIKPADVGRFSIDEKNRLYWDDQQIHTEVTLSRKQSAWAIAAIVSALAASSNAIASVWTAFFKATPAAIQQQAPPQGVDAGSNHQPASPEAAPQSKPSD